jgi:hypothetical protein
MSYLKLLRPLSDLVKILTNMFGVEDGKSHRLVRVNPDLSQDACVDVAHQHLAYCVEAVGDVQPKNGLVVLERMHTHLFVSVIIEIKCLPDQIQTVQVMHPFHIHEKASSMFVGTVDETGIEATRQSVFFGDDPSSIVDAQRFPCSIHLIGPRSTIYVFSHERAIEQLGFIFDGHVP